VDIFALSVFYVSYYMYFVLRGHYTGYLSLSF